MSTREHASFIAKGAAMMAHNVEVAIILERMADHLEIGQENPFHICPDSNAARLPRGVTREAANMLRAGEDLAGLLRFPLEPEPHSPRCNRLALPKALRKALTVPFGLPDASSLIRHHCFKVGCYGP